MWDKFIEYLRDAEHAAKSGILERVDWLGLRRIFPDHPEGLKDHGFPEVVVEPADEAITLLSDFFNDEGMTQADGVEIVALHVPPPGDEQGLSFWHSPKAQEYLDIQYRQIIHAVASRPVTVRRLFVFRSPRSLFDAEYGALMVLYEQAAIGIDARICFLKPLDARDNASLITMRDLIVCVARKGGEIVNGACFEHLPVSDRPSLKSLAYSQRFKSLRWHASGAQKSAIRQFYEEAQACWPSDESLKIPATLEEFRKFLIGVNETYENAQSEERKTKGGLSFEESTSLCEQHKLDFRIRCHEMIADRHLAYDRIRRKLEQEDREVWASDKTSLKRGLYVHATDPLYRLWLRASVRAAIKGAKVTRVYTLDDKSEEVSEFNRQMLSLSRLLHGNGDALRRTTIYVQSYSAVRAGIEGLVRDLVKQSSGDYNPLNSMAASPRHLYRRLALLRDWLRSMDPDYRHVVKNPYTPEAVEALLVRDFLCTPDVVYDYLNPRATIDQRTFNAIEWRVDTKLKRDSQLDYVSQQYVEIVNSLLRLKVLHKVTLSEMRDGSLTLDQINADATEIAPLSEEWKVAVLLYDIVGWSKNTKPARDEAAEKVFHAFDMAITRAMRSLDEKFTHEDLRVVRLETGDGEFVLFAARAVGDNGMVEGALHRAALDVWKGYLKWWQEYDDENRDRIALRAGIAGGRASRTYTWRWSGDPLIFVRRLLEAADLPRRHLTEDERKEWVLHSVPQAGELFVHVDAAGLMGNLDLSPVDTKTVKGKGVGFRRFPNRSVALKFAETGS